MAVQAISLARQHGLALPPPSRLDFEMASVNSLVQEGLRETARVAAPAGGAGDGAGGGAGGAGGAGGDGAPRAVRVSILERDGRDPMLKLTPAGGLSACAAGDLAAARALAAAGWQAAHAVDKHGNTALMWAAGSGRLEVVRWLLEAEGVAVRPACRRRRLGGATAHHPGLTGPPRPALGCVRHAGRAAEPRTAQCEAACRRETRPKPPAPRGLPTLRWARRTRMGARRSCGRARTARCRW